MRRGLSVADLSDLEAGALDRLGLVEVLEVEEVLRTLGAGHLAPEGGQLGCPVGRQARREQGHQRRAVRRLKKLEPARGHEPFLGDQEAVALERCKYTQPRIAFRLEQPDPSGVPVHFVEATASMFGSDAATCLGPVGVIDFNHDGRNSLFVVQSNGFRLLNNINGQRLHYKTDARVHGIITAGGQAVNITAGNPARVDLTLQLGGMTETVNVVAESTLIKTEQILNWNKADLAGRIHHQLWRNTVFAEWMARQDHSRTRAFHVNLVREGQDEASAGEFRRLIAANFQDRFQQFTWEQIYKIYVRESRLTTLRRYLETKTAGLKRAFNLS